MTDPEPIAFLTFSALENLYTITKMGIPDGDRQKIETAVRNLERVSYLSRADHR